MLNKKNSFITDPTAIVAVSPLSCWKALSCPQHIVPSFTSYFSGITFIYDSETSADQNSTTSLSLASYKN